ncbi:MAG: hypothetical protein IT405_02040 [Candidatus Yanofskybacteria bacterium]|nr:hypothetical protein [Candidatus Yanofskybacteria bacterium]
MERAFSEQERQEAKRRLLAYLREMPDDGKCCVSCTCGQHSYTVADLIQAVEQETGEGKNLISLFLEEDFLETDELPVPDPPRSFFGRLWDSLRSLRVPVEDKHIKP